ncbi:MAG TPA: DUF2784 domain-containing protein, partial [Micromonosporaceae bacterium]
MAYRWLADAIVGVHFAFLGYVIVGGFLALRWRRTIWTHLIACAWAVAIVTAPGLLCPLTIAQNWAMHRAGEPQFTGGFIDRYVENVIYPARYTPIVQALVALIVIASWVLAYRRRDHISHRTSDLRR